MAYNLQSPNGLLEPIDSSDVTHWYSREVKQVESAVVRDLLTLVGTHINEFIHWPTRAMLLWQGCDRVAPEGSKQKYHHYPDKIREWAKQQQVILDTRPNGPAIFAFQLAGGERPERFGSSNAWSIHHLYSGKFPYIGNTTTLHAVKDGRHFTQSAGLIATHPVSDALSDEYPFFAWLIRVEAFKRFGYDPDGVFSESHDELGFAKGRGCKVFCAG